MVSISSRCLAATALCLSALTVPLAGSPAAASPVDLPEPSPASIARTVLMELVVGQPSVSGSSGTYGEEVLSVA
jgi:hypothetical protein